MTKYTDKFLEEVDQDFFRINSLKKYSEEVTQKIFDSFNNCLVENDYNKWTSLIDTYSDEQYILSGQSRKLYIIISIVLKELSVHEKNTFTCGLSTWQEALDKYMKTTFALRRINLFQNSELECEAISYISSMHISPYAITIILINELFEDYRFLLFRINDVISPSWDAAEKLYFNIYVANLFPSEKICLEVASALLDCNNIALAYKYLKEIPSPSDSTIQLCTALEELIHESK